MPFKMSIIGGVPLTGSVQISGAKNAVLPILCAALLPDEPVTIRNVPHLHDVTTAIALLGQMGMKFALGDDASVIADPRGVHSTVAPYE